MGKKKGKTLKEDYDKIKKSIYEDYQKMYSEMQKAQCEAGYFKRSDVVSGNKTILKRFRQFRLNEDSKKTMSRKPINMGFYFMYGLCLFDALQIRLEGAIYSNHLYVHKGPSNYEGMEKLYADVLKYKTEAIDVFDFVIDAASGIPGVEPMKEEAIRWKGRIYNDTAKVAFECGDYENYITYAEQAVECGSIAQASMLVYYYTEQEDLNKAYSCFEKALAMPIDYSISPQLIYPREVAKVMSFTYMYHGYYNAGEYQKAMGIVKRLVDYLSVKKNLMKTSDITGFLQAGNQWMEDCRKAIEEIEKKRVSDQNLRKYFEAGTIELMSEEVKIYIDTSLDVYDFIQASEKHTLDYSATLMPIMKAVELLTNHIMESFLEYLHSRDTINLDYVNRSLKYRGALIHRVDRLEIGKAGNCIARTRLVSEGKEYIPDQYFVDFCITKGVKNPEETIVRVASRLDLVREKRNLVAHKNRVLEDDAQICFDCLLTNMRFIEFLIKTFSFCF